MHFEPKVPRYCLPEEFELLVVANFLFPGFYVDVEHHSYMRPIDARLPRGTERYLMTHPVMVGMPVSGVSGLPRSAINRIWHYLSGQGRFWCNLRLVSKSHAIRFPNAVCQRCLGEVRRTFIVNPDDRLHTQLVPLPVSPLVVKCEFSMESVRFFGGIFCPPCEQATWTEVEDTRDRLCASKTCSCLCYSPQTIG